jgi:hypothetical protein
MILQESVPRLDPDLSFDSVFSGSIKRLYSQMLLDPFEEQLYLPTAAIQVCNS